MSLLSPVTNFRISAIRLSITTRSTSGLISGVVELLMSAVAKSSSKGRIEALIWKEEASTSMVDESRCGAALVHERGRILDNRGVTEMIGTALRTEAIDLRRIVAIRNFSWSRLPRPGLSVDWAEEDSWSLRSLVDSEERAGEIPLMSPS